MKATARPLTAWLAAAVAFGASATWLFRHASMETPPRQVPMLAVQDMGHLVSVKVNHADVIEFTERITQDIPWTQWELRFGGTRVLLVARGDCLVGSDLRTARYEGTDEAARTTTLVLPAPTTISARVNHDPKEKGGSYFYAVDGTGLEPLIPGSANRTKAIDHALAIAQREIERSCRDPSVLATARANTEAVLQPAFLAIGWKARVRWLQ